MNCVLLVDDDIELTDMLSQYLANEGFTVDSAHDGETALVKARSGRFDLLVLDVMLPVKNGFDVLRELRLQSLLPVLMLTARDEDVDSVVGLELGADDYLPKPCNPRVLVARVRAILRRASTNGADNKAPQTLTVGDVELRSGTRSVICAGQPIALTSTEYSVLEVLMRAARQPVSKTDLSERALGRKLVRYDRSLDMHVSSLRKKLSALAHGEERIKTVRGIGYQYTRP